MFSNVYCKSKSKNLNETNELLLIDKYFEHIFGDVTELINKNMTTQINVESSTDKIDPSKLVKWESGMNVQAPFREDNLYYEAIIEKVFDDNYVLVRFLGFQNEEVVQVNELKPSKGEASIKEQVKIALREQESVMELDNNYLDADERSDSYKEINWKVGMPCRALYAPNEVVYEAIIQEISEKNRTAVVMMMGYGIPFEVSYENMYESIPELRRKQEITAKKNMASKTQEQKSSEQCMKQTVFQNFPNLQSTFSRNQNTVDSPQQMSSDTAPCTSSGSVNNNACIFSQCQSMLQPQNKSDALACLISSNYLSGYYAGYYDCMKKFE